MSEAVKHWAREGLGAGERTTKRGLGDLPHAVSALREGALFAPVLASIGRAITERCTWGVMIMKVQPTQGNGNWQQ